MQPVADKRRAQTTSPAPLGYALGGVSLLAAFAILHHPAGHGRAPADILASINQAASMDQLVHGALTVVYGVITAIMVLFAARLGLRRFWAALGLAIYCGAVAFVVMAAMTDGFVIPAIASGCGPIPSAACVDQALTMLRLSAFQIEFLTRFSLVGIATSALAWSVALLTTPGVPRWAGLVGLASGAGQLIVLLFISSSLTAATLLPVFVPQLVWNVVVALLMITGPGPFAGASDCRCANE